MNKDKYDLSLKLEKACRANKEVKFLTLCKQLLKRYRGSKILKTAGGKTVNEPYILCKISIRSQEQRLAYRSRIFRRSLLYKTLSIYSASVFVTFLETGAHMHAKEGGNVSKCPPITSEAKCYNLCR